MNTPRNSCRLLSISLRCLLAGAAVVTIVACTSEDAAPEAEEGVRREVVGASDDPGAPAEVRRAAQEATVDRFDVSLDFRFTDRQSDSGLDFLSVTTQDSQRDYKPNHYDHGNGVVGADVDGDGLTDVYFVNQLGDNALYRNLGNGRFEDITARAGVAMAGTIGVTASFADIDNDGDPDLYATTVRGGNVLFLNDGTGTFTDVTEESGLSHTGHSSGAVFFDYDRDGLLDLFLANVGRYTTDRQGQGGYYVGLNMLPNDLPDAFAGHMFPERTERSVLYRNLGDGRFEDVSEETGLLEGGWNGDASPADVNGDGWIDLYVFDMQGDDDYWENQGGQRFVRRTDEVFGVTPWGAMSGKFFDQNNDGRLDLMIVDMHSDMSQEAPVSDEKLKSDMIWPEEFLQGSANNIFGNGFYRQDAAGNWAEVSDEVGAENYWPWGLSVGDFNADGFEDVFVASSMNFPWRYHPNTLLLNNRGEMLLDAEYLVGIEPRLDGQEYRPWFRIDCLGLRRDPQRCGAEDLIVEIMGAMGTRGSLVFDLDGDGDQDIVTNEFHSEPLVLINDLADRGTVNALEVELIGTTSNRDGLGATVTVVAGGATYTKVHDGVSGYLGHSVLPLYFGLGDATDVESVTVRWPSGATQVVSEGITPGQRLSVTEGG